VPDDLYRETFALMIEVADRTELRAERGGVFYPTLSAAGQIVGGALWAASYVWPRFRVVPDQGIIVLAPAPIGAGGLVIAEHF
jgi:hypothetical protein